MLPSKRHYLAFVTRSCFDFNIAFCNSSGQTLIVGNQPALATASVKEPQPIKGAGANATPAPTRRAELWQLCANDTQVAIRLVINCSQCARLTSLLSVVDTSPIRARRLRTNRPYAAFIWQSSDRRGQIIRPFSCHAAGQTAYCYSSLQFHHLRIIPYAADSQRMPSNLRREPIKRMSVRVLQSETSKRQ